MPKAFVRLDGRPLLVHAAQRVLAAAVCDQLVLVVPTGFEDDAVTAVRDLPGAATCAVVAVAGGADRRSSVAAGLRALAPEVDVVLVHDAARCLTPPGQVAAVCAAVRTGGHAAVVPGLAVTDTVRTVGVDDDGTPLGSLLDREALRLVQTPQGFRREVLDRAHADVPDARVTDDATLVELLGERVHVVPGHEEALKVTRPVDLAVAAALLLADRAGEPA